MKFGDEIEMLRDYDGARYKAGDVYTVDIPGEPEDGKIRPNVAKRLCGPSADDEGPFARKIDDSPTPDDEE